MKILIVSGFLGAGKTTFIKKLIDNTHKQVAIFENEYGEVDVDTSRLANNDNIWEMAQGCICCSLKKDFASSVLTIANATNLEYLIVEPTGLGKLSEIIKNLKQIEYERINLLSPICVVDINSYQSSLNEYPSLYLDQIINSNTIIISKSEKASLDEIEAFKCILKKHNNKCDIYTYDDLDNDLWNRLFLKLYDGTIIEEKKDDILPDTYSIKNVDFNSLDRLIKFLEDLIRDKYGHIIRCKGHVMCDKHKYDVDVVNGSYSITDLELNSSSNMVFIGKDINKKDINEYLGIKEHKLIFNRK